VKILKVICGLAFFEHLKLINFKTNHLHEKIECVNRKSKMLLNAIKNNRLVDKEV